VKPAATRDPIRETTAMMIETMSTMVAECCEICCRISKFLAYSFSERKFPHNYLRVCECCAPKGTPLGTICVSTSWIELQLTLYSFSISEEFGSRRNLTPQYEDWRGSLEI
jgi:hypothetical protein